MIFKRIKCIERIFKRIKKCQSSRQSKCIEKKMLNNLFKKISEGNDNDDSKNNNSDNDDSEDNQISKFVDELRKKVSKEIVNNDNKKISKEIVNDDATKKSNQKSKENVTERIKKMEASENLFNQQFRNGKDILELTKKYKETNARKNKLIKELHAKIKDREEVSKKADEAFKI